MPRAPAPLPPMRCGLSDEERTPTVFSTPAAQEAGVSASRLRRGDLVSLGYGLWRLREVEPAQLDLLRALQDLHPEGVFTHATAARVLGLWLTGRLGAGAVIHLAEPRHHGGGTQRPGLRCHRLPPDAPVRVVDGVRVTTSPWTFVDLAKGGAQLDALVALGDSIVRVAHSERRRRELPPGVGTLVELREGVASRPRVKGIRAAREALDLVRSGSGSPQESRLRVAIVLAGVDEPEVNPRIVLSTGQWLRVDLAWLDAKVIVEYDGDQHRTDQRQWREDVERDANLRADGWEVIRVTADVFRPAHLETFLWQLREHLARRSPVGGGAR